MLVTNWTQFKATFGDFVDGYYLAHAVYGYFLNGGGIAYVVRVGGATPASDGSAPKPIAELTSAGDEAKPALTVAAKDPAQSANLTVEVQGASEGGDDTFKLLVKRGGEVVETFDNVTTRRGPQNVVDRRAAAVAADHDRGHPRPRSSPCRGTARSPSPSRRRSSEKASSARPRTSATRPTAPASAASRRSTTSRCSPCRT